MSIEPEYSVGQQRDVLTLGFHNQASAATRNQYRAMVLDFDSCLVGVTKQHGKVQVAMQ